MSGANNSSVETVNAAAAAIATTESRILQITAAERARRKSWFSSYWCFGSMKNTKRIGHATLVPDPNSQNTSISAQRQPDNPNQLPQLFAVPPSSPASFLQSEATSISHSPCSGPTTLPAFTVGPYAHETQLVTPPAFSALTTEPSTAPLTPPPESIFMTTPPSPEVPFARLLTSAQYPMTDTARTTSSEGTPVRRNNLPRFPKNLLETRTMHSVPLVPVPPQVDFNHRVSFELTPEDVVRCLERRSAPVSTDESVPVAVLVPVDETYHDLPEKVRHSISLPSNKEFKFDSTDLEAENEGPRRSWSFFPMIQQH